MDTEGETTWRKRKIKLLDFFGFFLQRIQDTEAAER
jgi:hypothetical protein